jgi:hypothetical protein
MTRLCGCKNDFCIKNDICDNQNYYNTTSNIDRMEFGNNFGNLFTNRNKYEHYINYNDNNNYDNDNDNDNNIYNIDNKLFDNVNFIIIGIIVIYFFFIIYFRYPLKQWK